MFQCEDCVVKKAVFGPGTEEFEMACTFCVYSAGRNVSMTLRQLRNEFSVAG